jgi:hypothetical protein
MAATYQYFSPVLGNRSMPPGSIIPELGYRDLRAAVGWLCIRERLRIGSHRVQLLVGQVPVVAYALPAADQAFVVPAEQLTLLPPENFSFGERQYSVEDTGGYRWTFSQSIVDTHPAE